MARMDLPARDIERYHAAALEMADEARRIVEQALEHGFHIETKADRSPVTDVDRAVELRWRELIDRWFPDHGVLGEEYPPARPRSPFQWIMDPIDGTAEFVHGIPTFGAMLALHYHEVALVGVIDHPALDIRVNAAIGLGTYRNGHRVRLDDTSAPTRPEDVRLVLSARTNFTRHVDEGLLFETLTRAYQNHRIYRTAYSHTVAVTGAADAMVDMHNHVWDTAPCQVLAEEAGGRFAVIRDVPAPDGRILSVVFGRAAVVERLVDLLGTEPPAGGR